MKTLKYITLLFLISFLWVSGALGAIYYVSQSGDGTQPTVHAAATAWDLSDFAGAGGAGAAGGYTNTDAADQYQTDPLFTNAGGGVFTLLPNSPARHGAVYIPGYTTKLRPESTWPSGVTTMEDILSIGAYGVYRGAAGM